jgi:ComF family protein
VFLIRVVNSIYNSVLALVYPQACLVCGGSVEDRTYGFACAVCWSATRKFKNSEVICFQCGRLTTALDQDLRCSHCGESLAFVHSCGVYEKALRQAVLSLKREPFIPIHLSELLRLGLNESPFDRCTRVVPVPLHPKRLKERGFNQAQIIGAQISTMLGLPLDTVSLVRSVHTERHRAGMDAKARRETVEAAFVVEYPRLIAGESVLLVDDVFTSGATATACARVLLQSGAKEVFIFTLARAGH